MSTNNVENLVSVDEINKAIEKFIGKHPENVISWIDGKNTIFQLSNVGLRDKLFYRLAYLVENTTIEDKLTIFKMPAKCVYVSDQTARFVCTINELVEFVKSQDTSSPSTSLELKKFTNRLVTSNVFKRAETIISSGDTDDSSKITVYIIGNPQIQYDDDNGNYVTWKVLDIIDIDAGTTWEDESFRAKLNKIKESSGIRSDEGEYGTFNIAFNTRNPTNENTILKNGKLVGMLPGFTLDPSIKVGDIIDSRNYKDYDNGTDIWSNGWGYQTMVDEYQKYNSFCDDLLYQPNGGENDVPFRKTLIPDGAIITI